MPECHAQSLLAQGNHALRARQYAMAIQHYLRLITTAPALGKKLAVANNLVFARRRYRRERTAATPHVAVCGSALIQGIFRRIDTLSQIYHPVAQVEIVMLSSSEWDNRAMSANHRDVPMHALAFEDEHRFTEQAMEFVLGHPYDLVHLAGPRMPEFIVWLLYKLVWESSILVHLDDEDSAYANTNEPLPLNEIIQEDSLLDSLIGPTSTRLALSLAGAFDQITVASPTLQQCRGGIVVSPISQEAQAACLKSPLRPLAPDLQRLCASRLLGSLFCKLPWLPTTDRNGVSIIILTLNGAALLDRLLHAFFRTNTHRPVELIVVDHGVLGDPADPTPDIIARYQEYGELCYIQRGANHSFSASCNLAAKWARYPNLLFLNNDIIYSADALPSALQKLDEPDIGIVGIRLDDDPDSLDPGQEPGVQHLGIEFPWSERRGYHHPRQIRHPNLKAYLAQEPSAGSLQPAVTGAFLFCRKCDFEELGGFSAEYDYGLEDIDFCLRMSRDLGKRSWCLTKLGLQHAESSTRKRDSALTNERVERNHRHFKQLWSDYTRQLSTSATEPNKALPRRKWTDRKPINILFILPHALDSNSGYHVQIHAARLRDRGADCVVAVPDAHHVEAGGEIPARSYSQALASPATLFEDGRLPDLIHAWTPREIVRRFVEQFREQVTCRLVIHLEDNEEYLTAVALNQPFADLAELPLEELDRRIPAHRYHPIRGRRFLDQADGLTLVIETLQRFNSRGVPSLILSAPADERLFYPRPTNYALRRVHGIPDDHCVLAYTGNVHQANKHEVAELYRAVVQLNQQEHSTHLLRTGQNSKNTQEAITSSSFTQELGWLQRDMVPEVLAAADILVQPGEPGDFNDQRIPSKLPEYFAMGRPVILGQSHIGLQSVHHDDAFVLESTTSERIVEAVLAIRRSKRLAEQLAQGARRFYERCLRISDGPLMEFMQNLVIGKTASVVPLHTQKNSMNPRLTFMKDRHAGERCVLVANGPSLNRMDLSFLKNETCIGMNKIYLGLRRFKFYPRYYVAINLKVVKQAADQIKSLNCVKFIGQAAAKGVLEENALTHVIRTHSCYLDQAGIRRPGFCHDLAREGMHEGWTVTYAALQIAHYLGFTEVIIIGMDHRYEYTGAPNEARVLEGSDPNHFSPDYFGGGQTWDNPDLAKSEESYRLAREEYELAGRRILDATLGGACTVFEKADYLQIFCL